MENDLEKDMFQFETEHLALKGNKDYLEMVKTIIKLETQRTQAIKDIDKIIELDKQLKEDPGMILQKIKKNEDLGLPAPIIIADIPVIDWHKYNVPIPQEALQLIDSEINTTVIEKKHPPPIGKIPKKENHSSTFNQPWTPEEQKRLEELLVKFPPEAVEMRRFKKIAQALGNRTVQQVSSRVQKYFLKLHQAGLPIPGRIPKTVDKKRMAHRHQRLNYLLYKPSTFFPETHIPVTMPENEEVPGPNVPPPTNDSDTNNDGKNEDSKPKIDLHLKIQLLKQIRIEKEKEKNGNPFAHTGYKCDICQEEPIIGCRWHCNDCVEHSIDFCTDCVVSQINSQNCHPLTHKLIPVDGESPQESNMEKSYDPYGPSTSGILSNTVKSEPSDSSDSESNSSLTKLEQNECFAFDENYMPYTFAMEKGKYNYLDPNFLPE